MNHDPRSTGPSNRNKNRGSTRPRWMALERLRQRKTLEIWSFVGQRKIMRASANALARETYPRGIETMQNLGQF
jgi:hypothetical protein